MFERNAITFDLKSHCQRCCRVLGYGEVGNTRRHRGVNDLQVSIVVQKTSDIALVVNGGNTLDMGSNERSMAPVGKVDNKILQSWK